MTFIVFVLLLINVLPAFTANENILCTNYCNDIECSKAITNCDIQNSTHNGILLPSPDICNCCSYCISYLKENEPCFKGSPDGISVTSICGPGLTCSDEEICVTMDTKCFKSIKDYDERKLNGSLGSMEMRPSCDGRGFYAPYKCIPGQTCYCVHHNGTRIFGLSNFTEIPELKLKCGCSRSYYDAVDIIGRKLHPNEHFRCTENGDYDPLQCIGDKCLCVDTKDGSPSLNTTTVNITNIDKLSCYDNKLHTFGYYKKCEVEYLTRLNETRGYKKVISYSLPNCDLDGNYAPLQENDTHKFCVDRSGEVLLAVEKSNTLADNMNCKCIRAASIVTSTDVPHCMDNGNYNPKQCRKGFCRCVDEDGNQICPNASSCPDVEEEDDLQC
ncbi:uncharacterized protein LOC109597338 [Aethina tumida]|uniref:uncharacterized protein LOC109597338 n=1 Tax=Aethina tumida TaxID=116153 RepID=UPI00096AF080|nr:uncharacterized protein LOC109597338 [Aethina tumida]